MAAEMEQDYFVFDLTEMYRLLNGDATDLLQKYISLVETVETLAGYLDKFNSRNYRLINSQEDWDLPSVSIGKIALKFKNKLYLLHIDRDNLYPLAIKAMSVNPDGSLFAESAFDGIWYEFRCADGRVRVPGSVEMGFPYDYTKDFGNTIVSALNILNSLEVLENSFLTGNFEGFRPSAQLLFIFLLEGSRFGDIREEFCNCLMDRCLSQTVDMLGMKNSIHNWSMYSAIWVQEVMKPEITNVFEEAEIARALEVLRIVKVCNWHNRKYRRKQARKIAFHNQYV